MDEQRLWAAASYLPTLVGLLLLDIALIPPAMGSGGGVDGGGLWLVGALLVVGGGWFVWRVGTARRRWVLGAVLGGAMILAGLGVRSYGQVGEFSDLAAAVTLMMALGAYLAFLGLALWFLATRGGRAIVALVLGLAGGSFLVGLAAIRWPAIPSEAGPMFLVALPLVAFTLAVAGSMSMVLATGRQDAAAR